MGSIIHSYGNWGFTEEIGFRLKPAGELFMPSANRVSQNLTGDGNVETIVDFFSFMLSFDAHISETQWESYLRWFASASQGKPFEIKFEETAWDTKTLGENTQTTVYVQDWPPSMSIGDIFFIRSPSTLNFEMNTIGDIHYFGPGLPVEIIVQDPVSNPMQYLYPEDSPIRYSRYFPSVVLTSKMTEFNSKRSTATAKTLEGYRSVSITVMEKPEY